MKTLPSMRCVRSRQNSQIFWNWPPKNIPDQQKPVAFQKSLKSAKSLHPTVYTVRKHNEMIKYKKRRYKRCNIAIHGGKYKYVYDVLCFARLLQN